MAFLLLIVVAVARTLVGEDCRIGAATAAAPAAGSIFFAIFATGASPLAVRNLAELPWRYIYIHIKPKFIAHLVDRIRLYCVSSPSNPSVGRCAAAAKSRGSEGFFYGHTRRSFSFAFSCSFYYRMGHCHVKLLRYAAVVGVPARAKAAADDSFATAHRWPLAGSPSSTQSHLFSWGETSRASCDIIRCCHYWGNGRIAERRSKYRIAETGSIGGSESKSIIGVTTPEWL